MAPEQLEGKETDARSDIFSFGIVLYEMLTGRRAFEGESQATVIAAILEHEPVPLSSIQPLTPPALDLLVRQCLAKSPDDRPDTAHDVASNLRWIRQTSGAGALSGGQPRPPRRRGLRTALVVASVVAGTVLGAGLMWQLGPCPPRIALTHPSLDVRPADEMSSAGELEPTFMGTPGGSRTALAWTPDLQAIVFVGRGAAVRRLYVRRFDAAEARPLNNTEGAQVPAVSADGQWVAFWAGEAIRKVPLGGGPVMDLASGIVDPPRGLAWDIHGRLFFGRGDGGSIWVIPADGVPKAATTVGEGEVAHSLPWPLPDGQTLLYTVRKRQWSWGDEEVVAQTLATGARKVLLKDAVDARYVPTGHLVFLRRGVLFAVPFDAQRVEIRGTPVAVLDTVAQALTAGEHRLRHWRWSVRGRGERGAGLGARPGGAVSRRRAGHGGPARAGLTTSGARAELRSCSAHLTGRPTVGGDDSQPHRRRCLAVRRGPRHHDPAGRRRGGMDSNLVAGRTAPGVSVARGRSAGAGRATGGRNGSSAGPHAGRHHRLVLHAGWAADRGRA